MKKIPVLGGVGAMAGETTVYLLNSAGGDQTDVWGYSVQVEVTGRLRDNRVVCRFVTNHPPIEMWDRQRAYAKNVAIPLSVGVRCRRKTRP